MVPNTAIYNNTLVDFNIKNIQFSSSGTTNIGIDFYACQKFTISNVRCSGFNYGVQFRTSWTFAIDSMCEFTDNNVGIKIPSKDSTELNFNTANLGVNSWSAIQISCRGNLLAGISIAGCTTIKLDSINMESNPVAIYLKEEISHSLIENIYYEAGNVDLIETDKSGNLASYILIIGKDENELGNTELKITQTKVINSMSYWGESRIWANNCSDLWLDDITTGRGYLRLGNNVSNIRSNTLLGDDDYTDIIVPNVGRNYGNHIHRTFPYNWIPNGTFSLPGLPAWKYTGSAEGNIGVKELDGQDTSVFDITLVDGEIDSTVIILTRMRPGADSLTSNIATYAALHAIASSSDINTVNLTICDANNTILNSTEKSESLTDWFTLTTYCDINKYHTPSNMVRYKIIITRTTAIGEAHLYIGETILADASVGAIVANDGISSLAGFHATIVTTTDLGVGNLQYTGTFDTNCVGENEVSVIASPRKLNDTIINFVTEMDTVGQVKIYSTVQNVIFDIFIIPLTGVLP